MSTSSSQIHLDPTEQTFLRHLDRFSRKQVPPVECRIAGGWVRDKLLSLPSSDLDVALTIPSGYSFATEFVDYLKGEGVSTGSVGKVAVNPEQSKHLETGTTRILGLECDFVGLRSETYADSRIPDQVRLGTPLEDALRRDLTINALFYNVHTKEIEDHTGHGISDLRNRVARTPLAPRQTFQDDPLRIIRTVRFASRFDLSIQKDVADAIMDPEVKIALQTKVSRERFGIEVTKMMQKSPYRALQLITSLGLHSSIFVAPVDPPRGDVMQVCDILRTVVQHFEDDYILWYTAATCPFRDMVIHSKKDIPAASLVLGEGLKTGNDIRDSVTKLLAVPRYIDTSASKRSDIGLMLKNSSVRPWKRSIAWCAAMSILPIWSGTWDHGAQAVLDRYLAFVAMVHDVGLAADIERPALLNGNEIKQLLELKPGPVLSVIGEAVTVWQLDHPEGTKEDCAQWLSDQWAGEGRVAWEESVAKGSKRKR